MISSLIRVANFPTLVPPYFCTIQVADGSFEFWCKLGGVIGDEDSEEEEALDSGGEDASDIVRL